MDSVLEKWFGINSDLETVTVDLQVHIQTQPSKCVWPRLDGAKRESIGWGKHLLRGALWVPLVDKYSAATNQTHQSSCCRESLSAKKYFFFSRKPITGAVNIWSTGALKDRRGVYCTQENSEVLHQGTPMINKSYFKTQQQWKRVRNSLLNMIILQTAKFPWWGTHYRNGERAYHTLEPRLSLASGCCWNTGIAVAVLGDTDHHHCSG